jgi:probable F420-dependent oxidoreductase
MCPFPLHPFRFGVLNFPACEGLAAQARRAEELGYDVFHLSDHFTNIAPVAAMTSAAMATTKIRIGSAVFGNDFWHPAVLAREMLAVDCLSNGRLEFGLGSGWYSEDYKQTCIPMDSTGVRISRLEESVQIYKGLLSGETVTFQGKYYEVSELNLVAKPTQHPHPPIMIGGGSKRVLSLAGREADIISLNGRTTSSGGYDPLSLSQAAFAQKIDWIREAAGERLAQLELSVLSGTAVVTDTPEQTVQEIVEGDRKWWGASLTPEQVMESPTHLIGSVEQIVEKILQNRERFGLSYYVIFDDALESFAPVVQRLAGK